MVTRVNTPGNYYAVLANLLAAQQRQMEAGDKVATQRNGNDLKDYAGMNEMFLGRFGEEPPVRTTITAAGGIPGNSLVEIDVIATL